MQCNLNLSEKTIEALDDMAMRGGWSRSKVADIVLSTALGVEGASAPELFKFIAGGIVANKTVPGEERAALVDG